MSRHTQAQCVVTLGVIVTATLTYVWPEHVWAHVPAAAIVNLIWVWFLD